MPIDDCSLRLFERMQSRAWLHELSHRSVRNSALPYEQALSERHIGRLIKYLSTVKQRDY